MLVCRSQGSSGYGEPESYCVVSGDPIPEGDDVLEFRLLYQGQLLGASRNDTRAEHKHLLRREFHKQLKRLWQTKPPLTERASRTISGRKPDLHQANPFASYLEVLAKQLTYHGYSFVPVVTPELFLTASLEILFLRPEEPRLLLQRGDIDGRVKTVFDALRVPSPEEAHSLKSAFPPTEDEIPMFCLLKDDKLVSEVKITADHLLMLPNEIKVKATDSFLVIHVRVKPSKLTMGNLDFA